jgi:DMSO/TMAO reductase YedYZ heme-binding membrane subunit
MMQGWRLTRLLSALLLAMSAVLLTQHNWDIEGVRLVIRTTARTSVILFVLAFTASALATLVPNDVTRWTLRNRRYLGVSFAVSHFIHLAAILSLAQIDRALFWTLTNVMTILLAGAAYFFIAAMAATSFDSSARWMGPRAWRVLHLVGAWYIWVSFAIAFGKRVPLDAFYWPWAALVALAGIVRLVAMVRRKDKSLRMA